MDYLVIFAASNDVAFQSRCRVATWRAAQNIASEDPTLEDHATRMEWASRVLTDNTKITDKQLAMQVLRNEVIAEDPAAAPDSDIQYQVDLALSSIMAVN